MASIQLAPPHLTGVRALWRSTIGKKAVVAVTGLIMLVFLLLHMLGNLKIFFGPGDFDSYAGWLRRIGEPVLHGAWFLWIQRAVLFVALLLHIVAAAQLSYRDLRARPTKYSGGQRFEATITTRYMRTGGAVLGLFILWHLLNLLIISSAGEASRVPHEQRDAPGPCSGFGRTCSSIGHPLRSRLGGPARGRRRPTHALLE